MRATLLFVSLFTLVVSGCAGAADEELADGEGASTTDTTRGDVDRRLAAALVGKQMVATTDVPFKYAGGLGWLAYVNFPSPVSGGPSHFGCGLMTTDGKTDHDVVARVFAKNAAEVVATVEPVADKPNWYTLTFTDPDTHGPANFRGACAPLPFGPDNVVIR
jgi:hypothetical protein